MNATYNLNQEKQGIEIFFNAKPIQAILDELKNNGFRWSNFKKCWYTKQSSKALEIAEKITNGVITADTITTEGTKDKTKNNKINSLWDRLQFVEGNSTHELKNRYKFVGSNYTGLTTKETAKVIREHLKKQFPEVKFSITSEHNKIDITIKASPYNNLKLEYSREIEPSQYRKYSEENNKELNNIIGYCEKLLNSYNYDDSDMQSDYFNTHYYDSARIAYDYIQTEQTEEHKQAITEYRECLTLEARKEEEKKEIDYQNYLKQEEIRKEQYQIRLEEEKKEIELINNSTTKKDLADDEIYYIQNSQFANMNKNQTLQEYKEEVESGKFALETVKITRELHLENEQALKYFENHLLTDFDFLEGSGGSYTDDKRINSMMDWERMSKEERQTVKFNLIGIAVYYNNQLQFIINTEGFSYARYVGLVENVAITKTLETVETIDKETLEQLQLKAAMLEDYSLEAIDCDPKIIDTWNNENWKEYKHRIKAILNKNNFKLTNEIIRQLPEDSEKFRLAMYKLISEVDGVQEQFEKANIQQGQKVTIFKINDWGMMGERRITVDEITNAKYAQFDDVVKITFTPEGKRKQYYNYFYDKMLVFNGWVELPKTVLHNVEESSGMIITTGKFSSCDSNQYNEIINYFEYQGIKPIINTYKPTF